MADRFRIVTIGKDGRARLVEDLEVADVVYSERDTRTFTPGGGSPRSSSSSTRHGGSITTGELVGNGAIAATLAVKGPDPAAAAATVERILERVRSSRRDLYIEWRPENLGRSAYSAIRGPGAAQPGYRWVEWAGARRVGIAVSWPVAPLPQALPLAIYERFDPPGDKQEGTTNLVVNPNAAGVTPWATLGLGTFTEVDPAAAAGVVELGGPGRGRYISITNTGAGGSIPRLVYPGPETRAVVKPGGYYAYRATVKIRTAFVNASAQPLRLVGQWEGVAGVATIESTPADIGTYAVGTVLQFAGVIQAPAAATALSLGLEYNSNANGAGAVSVGRLMVARVTGPTSAVPAYGDGETPLHRWAGVPHGSPSVELAEEKLADYTRLTPAPSVERVGDTGLYQKFTTETSGGLAHTARHPVADGELLVGAVLRNLDTGGTQANLVTPGIRYRPDDGRYLWVRLSGGNMTLNWWDGAADYVVDTVAHGGLPAITGRPVWMILRAEGDQVTAEWYGSAYPTQDRTNYANRLRFTFTDATPLKSSNVGAVREGYPIIRARGMADGGAAEIVAADWRPYTYTEQRLPATVPLRGVPGTAPAQLTPALGLPGTGVAQQFAAFGWGRRAGRQNIGNDGRTLGGYIATGGATLTRGDVDVPAAAPADVEASVRIQAHATTSPTGATWRAYGNFQRGRAYTLELWVKAVGSNFALSREDTTPAASSSYTSMAAAIAPASGWQRYRSTIFATANLRSIGFTLTTVVAGAGNRAHVAAVNVYEGTGAEAPTSSEQINGRGGAGALAVIPGAGTIEPATIATPGVGATANELLNGLAHTFPLDGLPGGAPGYAPGSIDPNTGTLNGFWIDPGSADYYLDPLLFDAPAFAGDTIDVVVFAMGLVDIGATNVRLRVSANHEHDPASNAPIYTREFGVRSRALFPFAGATASSSNGNPPGFVTRLGTLSLPRRRGRVILKVAPGVNAGATAGAKLWLGTIVVLPAAALVSGPTSKPYLDSLTLAPIYPSFAPVVRVGYGAGSYRTQERRIRPDGSGVTVLERGEYPYGTLGGEPIEVEPGDAELLAWCYDGAPDDTSRIASSGLYGYAGVGPYAPGTTGARVSVDVTPRYRLFPA